MSPYTSVAISLLSSIITFFLSASFIQFIAFQKVSVSFLVLFLLTILLVCWIVFTTKLAFGRLTFNSVLYTFFLLPRCLLAVFFHFSRWLHCVIRSQRFSLNTLTRLLELVLHLLLFWQLLLNLVSIVPILLPSRSWSRGSLLDPPPLSTIVSST